jgi:hypothetical protein
MSRILGRAGAEVSMNEPIYGQWFLTKDVPVPLEDGANILTAFHHSLTADAYDTYALKAYTDADAWLRIPPPPWLEGK